MPQFFGIEIPKGEVRSRVARSRDPPPTPRALPAPVPS